MSVMSVVVCGAGLRAAGGWWDESDVWLFSASHSRELVQLLRWILIQQQWARQMNAKESKGLGSPKRLETISGGVSVAASQRRWSWEEWSLVNG